jgi:hypothetical protein
MIDKLRSVATAKSQAIPLINKLLAARSFLLRRCNLLAKDTMTQAIYEQEAAWDSRASRETEHQIAVASPSRSEEAPSSAILSLADEQRVPALRVNNPSKDDSSLFKIAWRS